MNDCNTCKGCPDGVFDPPGTGGPGGWLCSRGFEPDEPECPFFEDDEEIDGGARDGARAVD